MRGDQPERRGDVADPGVGLDEAVGAGQRELEHAVDGYDAGNLAGRPGSSVSAGRAGNGNSRLILKDVRGERLHLLAVGGIARSGGSHLCGTPVLR